MISAAPSSRPTAVDLVVATVVTAVLVILGSLVVEVDPFGWVTVGTASLAWVLLATRRLWPAVALAVSTIASVTVAAFVDRPGPLVPTTLFLLFSYCLSAPRASAIVAGVLSACTLYVAAVVYTEAEPGSPEAVIMLTWSAVAVAAAIAIRSTRQNLAAAHERARHAEETKESEAQRRVAEERLNIARELHDILGHNLSIMVVHTGVAEHMLTEGDVAQARESLHAARHAGQSALGEVRQLLGILRSSDGSNAPVETLPGVDDIGGLVDALRTAGTEVRWTRQGTPTELTQLGSLTAYRVVQEGLTNAARHGDGVIDLDTTYSTDELTITVTNGIGTNGDSGAGLGLVGMRERVAAADGHVTVTRGGGRFELVVTLPNAARTAEVTS
jgi:signal transduction histidine kinase